jgi:hypothetical protein
MSFLFFARSDVALHLARKLGGIATHEVQPYCQKGPYCFWSANRFGLFGDPCVQGGELILLKSEPDVLVRSGYPCASPFRGP